MKPNKREYFRFLVNINAFVAFGRKLIKFGRLKDISVDGLAFEYASNDDLDSEDSQLDIFLPGDLFHISKIPCKVIYDKEVDESDTKWAYEDVMTKRCGVMFGTLTSGEMSQLEFFLEKYTAHRVISLAQ